jgi:hypothetical protein
VPFFLASLIVLSALSNWLLKPTTGLSCKDLHLETGIESGAQLSRRGDLLVDFAEEVQLGYIEEHICE